MAFVSDEESRAAIAAAAKNQGYTDAKVEKATVEDVAKRLPRVPTPMRLVVDISNAADPLKALEVFAQVCDDGTRVIVIGSVNDVNVYRSLLATGIDDYLVKPINAANLAAVFQRQDELAYIDNGGGDPGQVVPVVGTRGGVGATSTAVNLAWLFAHEYGLRTALVDLDLYFGTCARAFDLSPNSGLREALADPRHIDERFVERAMLKVSDTLSLLAPEDNTVEAHRFDINALRQLVETLRKVFSMVVMDIPRFDARTRIGVLEPPLAITLVTDPSLAGLRDTVKLSNWFKKLVSGADTLVVMNRVGAARQAELEQRDFEANAGLKLTCTIPLDVKAVGAAAAEARPLVQVAPRSRAGKALGVVASHLAGSDAKAEKTSAWQRLLKARG